jgi:DNA repair protein RecO (recombination protein O)
MRQLVTEAIILSRTDYGEADRILTLLTPQYGKLSLLAKGVRRIKSKLAGGIELFSVSEITFIQGRGSVGTLVSTRLVKYYGAIVGDLERTMFGYDLIKQLHKATEDEPEEAYYELLREAFEALNDPAITLPLIKFWFNAQMLRLSGHTPNLQTDNGGNKLVPDQQYEFDYEHMAFMPVSDKGTFGADHIKFLRLAYAAHPAKVLAQIQGNTGLVAACAPVVHTITQAV